MKAAESCGVNERTLRRWLGDHKFRAAFRSARRQTFTQAMALTQRYTPMAVNMLAKVMTDPMSPGPILGCTHLGDLIICRRCPKAWRGELQERDDGVLLVINGVPAETPY